MSIGVLTLQLQLPGCASLKEKRSRLKPLLFRLHREFNLTVCEMDAQDAWDTAVIACAAISNDAAHIQRMLKSVAGWVENNWPDVSVVDDRLELI
jgi:uncharacterized protein